MSVPRAVDGPSDEDEDVELEGFPALGPTPNNFNHGTGRGSSATEPLLPRHYTNDQNASASAVTWLLRQLSRPFFHQYSRRMDLFSSSRARRLIKRLEVASEPGLTNGQLMLTNHDLKPVEPERRLWGPWNFVGFWIADSFNIGTWMISSTMIMTNGLSWWQAWLCVWVGYFLAACFVCLTGRIGATYHIPFPVVARASFGIWGSLWPVFNRTIMACIWYGVQSWIGGTSVTLMIRAIWSPYENIPNGIPDSGTTTRDFVSFFLFWACSLPAIWFPVQTIRHLFTVKAIVTPVAGIALFIWAIKRAHGLGPIIHEPSTAHGSDLAWGIIGAVMSSIANFATLIVNNPDFTRFARCPKDAFWPQLISIPTGFAFTSFIGITVSSSSKIIFGTTIWNPLELLSQFLTTADSHGERFAIFLIAAAFALAQLGTNIAANSVSAGTDMTALLPRFITIRRGGYICALVGLVICPWHLLSSSNNFTTYLAAYSVFLSSIAGVIICDYYVVRRGYLDLQNLYSADPSAPYYYWHGWSWRAYASYACGILINIVGFIDALGTPNMPRAAVYIYRLNFFAGFIVSGAIYFILCNLWPVPAVSVALGEHADQADMTVTAATMCEQRNNDGDEERRTASQLLWPIDSIELHAGRKR